MRSDDRQSNQEDPWEAEAGLGAPGPVALIPAGVIALGAPTQPIEGLMVLQSGFARLVRTLTGAGWRCERRLHGLLAQRLQ